MIINSIDQNNVNFKAQAGNNLLKKVYKEFDGDNRRVEKFQSLITKTYKNITDENTIIDINSKDELVFSHKYFPRIKYETKHVIEDNDSISKKILNECSKKFSTGETLLFQKIISTFLKKNKNFDSLKELATFLTSERSKEKFLSLIEIAQKIKKDKPKSNLTPTEYIKQLNIETQEAYENQDNVTIFRLQDLSKKIK